MSNKNSYPRDIFVSIKTTKGKAQTLSVASHLQWQEDKPLSMENLSRYYFTIINKFEGGGKEIVIANIPATEISPIVDIYRETMMQEVIKTAMQSGNDKGQWPQQEGNRKICELLDKKFTMGANKGKSYYEVPLDDLVKHRDFLCLNVAKYPNNQGAIDEINSILSVNPEHLKKCYEFMANRKTSSPGAEVTATIYDSGLKPKMSSKKGDKVLCYQISIIYDNTRTYPFIITITNLYCSVEVKSTGQLNCHPADAEEKKQVSFVLSKQSGRELFGNMEANLNGFKNSSYMAQHEKAVQIEKNNIAAAKNQNNQYQQSQGYAQVPQGYQQYPQGQYQPQQTQYQQPQQNDQQFVPYYNNNSNNNYQ